MPTHERLGPDDRENPQNSRKPAIQLDDAINHGAFGSPTFVGSEIFFGKDQLHDCEESIIEQTRQLAVKWA